MSENAVEGTVGVKITCGRTGRVHLVEMSVTDADKWLKAGPARSEIAGEVESFLKGLPPEAPDLAVLYKGKVVVLPHVVVKEGDTTVLRLLHDLTHSETFPEVAPGTARKKRAKSGNSTSNDTNSSDTSAHE